MSTDAVCRSEAIGHTAGHDGWGSDGHALRRVRRCRVEASRLGTWQDGCPWRQSGAPLAGPVRDVDACEVRPAALGDAAAIVRLNRYVHDPHVAAEPADFRDVNSVAAHRFFGQLISRDEQVVLVAVDSDGQAIGYLWAQDQQRPENPFTQPTRTLYIHHVAVAPDARRRGAGAGLMAAVEAEAARRGITRLGVDHWTFNETAQRFFTAHRFEPYNVRMRRDLT